MNSVIDSKAHLKLTIRDIYNCSVSDDGLSFFCTLFSDKSKESTLFQNVRIHGLVMQKNNSSFVVDDGTGVIIVKIPRDSYIEIPNVSDYVEVLGKLQIEERSQRVISALSCSKRNEPMEEVFHLLEQAAIHQSYSKYRQLTQQSFLSSETNTPNVQDDYTIKVLALFRNHTEGLKIEDIQKVCDNDINIAKQVIESLLNNMDIYQKNDSYIPI